MGSWTSLAVLALAVVSTLSFPHPEPTYKIPAVGQGRRSQYYILHSDGTYKYGYDTLGGTYEQAMAKTPGQLSGEFGYKDPTGADVKLEYTADDRGFIASGSHLPVAPDATLPAASPSITHVAPSVYKAPESAPEPAVHVSPSVYEVAEVSSSSDDAGSYSFSYETSSSSRKESGDADNAVKGTYSYITDDGADNRFQYIAGAGTGFIVRGDSLPVGPPVPGAESGIPTGHIVPVLSEEEANAPAGVTYTAGVAESPVLTYTAGESPSDASYSFSYDAGDSSRYESADANLNIKGHYSFIPPDLNQKLTVNYIAGADTGFVAEGDHLPTPVDADFGTKLTAAAQPVSPVVVKVAPAVSPDLSGAVQTYSADDSPSDASYSFSYDAGDSARSETADANLNIEGSYSFVPPGSSDRLSVKYIAGSATGFVAEGDHLPVAHDASVAAELPASPAVVPAAVPSVYKAPESAPEPAVHVSPSVYEVAEVSSSSDDAGSYSFSYETSSSSRKESGDADNAVKGTYSYITDDGADHRFQYIAGAGTGYIVRGDSLPVGPPVPGAESGIPTGHIVPVLSEEEANALAGVTYTAGVAESPVLTYTAGESPSDASYSFSYDAGDSSRYESADANLNIKGHYSFIPPDLNQKLTVNYIAGADTGFVAEGDHLPIPVDADFGTKLAAAAQPISPAVVETAPAESVQTYRAGDSLSDASYSFSYDAGDSARSETADSDLNIEGSFSFVPPDLGHRLSVKYIAGADTGFVAEGDHLPVAPEVPAAHEPAPPAAVHAAVPAVYKAPEVSKAAAVPAVIETVEAQSAHQPVGYSSHVVGDVLLHQYGVEYPDKYGYVFTAL